ncbi:MAG: response regulator transcription factor [bacterium]
MRVLLVEDDRAIGGAVRDHIAAAGHAVDWARDLATARDLRAVSGYELLLLDLGLPDGSGIDLLREMRRAGDKAAVLILSARDQIAQRIEGLNAGADDYLVKPFDLEELSARVAAVARRYASEPNSERTIGGLTIDTANRRIALDGETLALSAREWAVLERLLRTVGAVVSKSEIEEALYAFGAEVESNTVEVYVSRLRKKLGGGAITTIRGLGYKMNGG